jgi:hypothetical protein
MKKKLLLSAMMLSAAGAMAQLPPNSFAPDFTATDIDGNTQHLYDYLDQGYTVFLDISAAWCGPCWNYHNTGALEDLYTTYGPGTADNKVMVFFIEGESTNTLAQITGTTTNQSYSGFTQGDWTAGTPYPIIDNATIANDYEITYFPTIYMVCPNRIVNEVGQETTAQLWGEVGNCAAPETGINASLAQYQGQTVICDNVDATVVMQNMGLSNLTSATVVMKEGSNIIATQDWTGDLATYNTASVVFPTTPVSDPSSVTFAITTPDANDADNTLNPGLSGATPAMANLTFTLNLDYYCAETTWKLFNSAGTIVHSGGPYNCSSANGGGADAHTTKTYSWTVPQDCYKMVVYDAYGDGMASAMYGNPPDGNFQMVDGGGHLVYSGGGNFGQQYLGGLNVNMPAGIDEMNTLSNSLSAYPNPSTGIVNLNYNLDHAARVTIEVYNALGELVLAHSNTVPAGLQLEPMDFSPLDNGIYFMNITADGLKASRTITLNK